MLRTYILAWQTSEGNVGEACQSLHIDESPFPATTDRASFLRCAFGPRLARTLTQAWKDANGDAAAAVETLGLHTEEVRGTPMNLKEFIAWIAGPIRDDTGCTCECGARFASPVALLSHRVRKHQYRNPLRYKLDSTICCGCLKDFHTPARIFKHLAYGSTRCRSAYDAKGSVEEQTSLQFWSAAPQPDGSMIPKPPVLVDVYHQEV